MKLMRTFSALIICGLCLALTLAAALAQSAAGLRWTAPPGWKSEAPRPMRAATYSVAPVAGDESSASIAEIFA